MSLGEILNLIDWFDRRNDSAATSKVLPLFSEATNPDDIQFIQRTAGNMGVTRPESLQSIINEGKLRLSQLDTAQKLKDKERYGTAVSSFAEDLGKNNDLPPSYVLAYQTPEDRKAILSDPKSLDDMLRGLNTGVKDFQERNQKESDRTDLAEVLRQGSALLKPNLSGPNKGRYPDANEVLGDYSSLLADYPGAAPIADKLLDNARQQMQNSFETTPQFQKVGNDMTAYFRNLYNAAPVKKLETDRAPNVTVNAGDKDAKRFDHWIGKLQGLQGRIAGIRKGFDPVMAQVIKPENIEAAIAGLQPELDSTEGYIKQNFPGEWSKYRKGAPAAGAGEKKVMDAGTAKKIWAQTSDPATAARKAKAAGFTHDYKGNPL